MLNHGVSDASLADRWNGADWHGIEERVSSMQAGISRASMEGDGNALALLTERFLGSIDARMLAVRNVTRNEATDDPGVGEAWVTASDMMKGALVLSHHGYVSEPFLTFSMFEPKTKKDRTMCIPTFYDRAMHDLYRMLMEPICEPLYDQRLFSSRTGRSLADAVEEVRRLFSGKDAPEWVVRCDVRSFYDTMSHEWLLDNVPMDRSVLEQFLRAERVWKDDGGHEMVTVGVPTGNRLSSVLANLILNGIEDGIRFDDDPYNGTTVRWVDDLVITARTEEDALRLMARVRRFLGTRGMVLNEDKSYVIHRDEGFEFLRFGFFRNGDAMDIRPTRASLQEFMQGVAKAIRAYGGEEAMVRAVNNRIRGFVTKYRTSDIASVSERIDGCILDMMLRETGRHSLLLEDEIRRRFARDDGYGGVSFMSPSGKSTVRLSSYPRVPHERVWLTANPYLDTNYFRERGERQRESKVVKERDLWHLQDGCCAICGMRIGHDCPRRVAEDIDGTRGFIHSGCWEDTEYARSHRRFRIVPECGAENGTVTEVPEPVTAPVSEDVTAEDPVNHMTCQVSDEGDTVSEVQCRTMEDGRSITQGRGLFLSAGKDRVIIQTPSGRPSKFQALADFIGSCGMSFLDMRIEVVDQIMGGDLCDTAKNNHRWWQRVGSGSVNNALGQIGWSVYRADIGKGTVRFQHQVKGRRRFDAAEQAYIDRRDPVKGPGLTRDRDAGIQRFRYGRMTEFLLACDYDQVRLSFKDIGTILGFRLPEGAWNDRKWWCNRRDIYMLAAIEAGDFSKTVLDMDEHWVLLTRTCCVPEPDRGTVRTGTLKVKPHMMLRSDGKKHGHLDSDEE